jgi:hypothetical protein
MLEEVADATGNRKEDFVVARSTPDHDDCNAETGWLAAGHHGGS